MRAEKFYLGFPPAAVKKKFGETEYGIGFIPLGGYVKISGMTREEELPDEVKSRAYVAKPVWQRIIVISAGAGYEPAARGLLLFFVFYWQGIPEYQATVAVADHTGRQRRRARRPSAGRQTAGRQRREFRRSRGLARLSCAHSPASTVTLIIERDGNQHDAAGDCRPV